jgi:hypothetical protein
MSQNAHPTAATAVLSGQPDVSAATREWTAARVMDIFKWSLSGVLGFAILLVFMDLFYQAMSTVGSSPVRMVNNTAIGAIMIALVALGVAAMAAIMFAAFKARLSDERL